MVGWAGMHVGGTAVLLDELSHGWGALTIALDLVFVAIPVVAFMVIEARRRRLLTVGFAGYDGGDMARSDVVDYCFVVRSQSVHRIQESQAILGCHLWAATQQAMHKTVDRWIHPDVPSDPSSGPNPNGGTE